MITTIDKETVIFLAKHKLTFNQYCILLLLHQRDVASIIQYTCEIGFLSGGTVIRPDRKKVNELQDLIDRNFLIHDLIDKEDIHSIENYVLTDKFLRIMDVNAKYKQAAAEFWGKYPNIININGRESATGKSVEYDDFVDKYTEILKKDFNLHKHIMEVLTKQTKANPYAQMGIMKYLGSKQWEGESNVQQQSQLRIH